MSANFHGSFHARLARHRRAFQRPPSTDLDTTADVHEEFTADLEPATADIVRNDAQTPELTSPPAPRARVEEPPRGSVARDSKPEVSPPTPAPITVDVPVLAAPVENKPAITVDVPVLAAPVENKPSPQAGDVTDDVFHQPARAPVETAARPAETASGKISSLKAGQSHQRPALAPGKVLCDRYLLEQVIGCGGTAIVFRARDMLSGKGTAPNIQVAIKTPRPELGDPERAAKRLKHEFEHAKLLSHPSIVRVFDLYEDEGRSFITMELVQGKLLSQLLRDWTMVPVSLAYKILRQCAEALKYAHSQNVVHGDFKPGNVFITPDEGVRIVDFGTAAGPTGSNSRIPAGTPTYASPEVLSGDTPDQRDDVFSFACVAYELLTGQHPFGRQSSLQARDEGKIPPRAWNLSTTQWLSLLSALSWKRDARPTSVEDLLTRLNPEQPMTAAPAPIHVDPEDVVPAELPEDLMPKQRSWGFFAFIACALLVTYFAFQRHGGPDETPAPSLLPATTSLAPTPSPPAEQPEIEAATAPAMAVEPEDATPATVTAAPTASAPAANRPRPAAPVSEISFESSSVVTSESSVAAVFLIKRSQPLSGRVSVSWRAVSGTADAGIDFADASGTVTFADGQAQRAIYVQLRNDLLKEGDENFYVELLSPKSARLGQISRAEAIIRDDD